MSSAVCKWKLCECKAESALAARQADLAAARQAFERIADRLKISPDSQFWRRGISIEEGLLAGTLSRESAAVAYWGMAEKMIG